MTLTKTIPQCSPMAGSCTTNGARAATCRRRIGPSFIGETDHYPRFTTDKGMFEIVYGGATGAMQAFGNHLTQDQILRVMAMFAR